MTRRRRRPPTVRLSPDEHTSPVARLLSELPELVARAEAQGAPVVVDDPGTEHGRKLLLTLGATIRKRRGRTS